MKPRSHLPFSKPLAFVALLLSLAFASRAAQPRPSAPAPAPAAATNALPAQPVIPQSVFIMPSTPQEGKDPFFPRSMRPYGPGHEVVKTNAQSSAIFVELRLNGISGSAERRLAIINNRTFEVNEEGMVSNPSGAPVRIRCLDIKAESVLVQIGGEQRILRLRPGF
jgi:hypothetical protein